jgi:tryptophan 7-halogenase
MTIRPNPYGRSSTIVKPIKSIVVVGGGSAGWITAGVIAARHKSHSRDGVKVTLIESPNIPTVGVGEGTWPTMRSTLIKLGISETEFIRECDASFKQGAKFARWMDGTEDDYYYHPLMLPQGFPSVDLAPYWHKFTANDPNPISFSQGVCFQEAACDAGLAPKLITTPEFGSVANYAYHLDTAKFAPLLQRHCTQKLGVTHILDNVVDVISSECGDISHLVTKNSGNLEGDLFIDCTGFASVLLGKHFSTPFVDRSDVLFIDNALAVQVPYEHEDSPIASHTIATAQSAGWVWDIALPTRRGVGYVYSSRHTSEDEAHQELRAYVGPAIDKLSVRKIPIRSGHRATFWKRNCVGVGLSAGFVEPLEASALVLIELSAEMISQQLPACREVMDITAKRFNDVFSYRWDRIIDFLKLHYSLSKRTDSQFWIDNRDPATIPESLQNQVELWRYQSPGDHDFTSNNEVFPAASYQYVLYGMGFKTDFRYRTHMLTDEEKAKEQFAQNASMKQKVLKSLPTNRELINKIHQHGLQKV